MNRTRSPAGGSLRPPRLGAAALLALLAGCATTGGPAAGGGTGAPAGGPGLSSVEPAPAQPPREAVEPFQRDFNQALRLLEAGQFAQAGEAFEACAAADPANPKGPLAIFNAAIAWEKANQLDQAAALRQRLISRSPGSREAEAAQPLLAALRSRQGKKDEAIRLYRDFVERYPESAGRCGAAYNLGATLDEVRRPLEAAAAYLVYGSDPRCARGDANAAARILYRAGEQLERGGQMAEARKAYQACGEVTGVVDPAARVLQDEARKRGRR